MVPLSRSRVLSKLSFIFSARADESLISSPIAIVICVVPHIRLLVHIPPLPPDQKLRKQVVCKTHILQDPNLPQDPVHLLVVLALELAQHGVAVLAFGVGRC